jgi:16S rRNA (guanine527-N7)-methyltransferase
MPTRIEQFSDALSRYANDFGVQLTGEHIARLSAYYELLLKWNQRFHLVAPCSPAEFATRHILESLFLLRHVPAGASLIDIGSGAGLPALPCLIVRDDLRATLIESSQKKAVFLREAVKLITNPQRADVIAKRFAETPAPPAGFVTCRALDRFEKTLPELVAWAVVGSTLLLFAGPSLRERIEALLPGTVAELIPGSERRFLIVAGK